MKMFSDEYSLDKPDEVNTYQRLKWLLENYVESEDGVFTFPDGDSWKCKKKEKQ